MTFKTIDPYTGLSQKSYEHLTEAQIDNLILKLHESQKNFAKLNILLRQKIVAELAQRMTQHQFELATLMTSEMGKPIKESVLEINKCIKTLERVASSDLSFLAQREVHSIYKNSLISHEPLGVIYSIMPWNFPVWQVIRMAIPAIISGNVILLKHSEITPEIGIFLQNLFDGLYEAPIFLNAIISHAHTDYVLKNTSIGGVSLTGSIRAGHAVYEAAAKNFKKVVLELGGSDPYLVLEDADLKLAAQKITKGRLSNCGQVCIAAKRALVHSSKLNEFLDLLKSEFETYVFGNPQDPKTDIGPLAHPRFKEALIQQLADLRKNTDARLVYKKAHGQSENSAFVDLEIYLIQKNLDWLKDQEFFAPILLVTPFNSIDEAVQIANSTDFALGAGVFSQDAKKAGLIADKLVAGQVAVNNLIATDLDLPFGGFKNSGFGRELGLEGYFEFTQTKVISYS